MNKSKISVTLIGKCDEENYVIEKVTKALKDWGRPDEARRYHDEVSLADDWAEVMKITAKYVDIV